MSEDVVVRLIKIFFIGLGDEPDPIPLCAEGFEFLIGVALDFVTRGQFVNLSNHFAL